MKIPKSFYWFSWSDRYDTNADCAGAIFYAMMKLALEIPHPTAGKYFDWF